VQPHGNIHKWKTIDNMSQFPISYNKQDSAAVVEAVNYVLSGPSGLGQNFDGLSGYNFTYLTGNGRPPFTVPSVSVNALGGATTNTVTVDSVDGIREGYYVGNASNTIGVNAQVAVGGVDAATKIITLTVANTNAVSGLVNFVELPGASLYVAPIVITSITWLSAFTVSIVFAAQPSPPFALGNNVQVSGSSVPIYDFLYTGAGVISCTTTTAIVRSNRSLAPTAVGVGGTVSFANTIQPPVNPAPPAPNDWIQTDCVADASVTGATDRVFISAQLDQRVNYTATAATVLRVTTAINRYRVINIGNVVSPELRNVFDSTIAQRSTVASLATGSGTLSSIATVFNTFIDEPPPGFYSYRLEVLYRVTNSTGALQVTGTEIDVRTLSTQVVKQ
jgi:hypothetical protein